MTSLIIFGRTLYAGAEVRSQQIKQIYLCYSQHEHLCLVGTQAYSDLTYIAFHDAVP